MATRFEGRDFLELRQEMINFMKERLGDSWTDEGEADDIMTMIELLAYLTDSVHYYIDGQKRESDIVTSVFPRNVIQKAIRDGYKPHFYVAASGVLTLSFEEATSLDITIPRGTYFQTEDAAIPEDNMIVVTTQEYVIPAGTKTFDIEVREGTLVTETKTRADITQSGYIRLETDHASGEPSSVYSPANSIIGTTRFSYNGEDWQEVDDVYTDFRIGRIFSVHYKYFQDSQANIIQLPYNWTLFITDLSTITIEYLETHGAEGNIGTGRVTRCNSVIYDSANNDVTPLMTITNPQPITSGLDPEDVDSIKVNFKSAIKDLETLVTLEDYEDFVRIYTGKECVAIDWRTAPSIITDAHVIRILVDVEGSQLEDLKEELENRQGRSDIIQVGQPIYDDYVITAKVYLAPTGDTQEEITNAINSIIEYNYKELPQRGKAHFRSEIISFIHEASERVKSVDLQSPITDIIPEDYEIPRYTAINLSFEVTQWT